MSGALDEQHFSCPICLEGLKHAVTTSCGHCFCAQCFLSVWERRRTAAAIPALLRPCECPVCRRPVSMAVPNYLLRSASFARSSSDDTDSDLDRRLNAYNARFSDAPRPARDRLFETYTLGRRLFLSSALFKAVFAASVLVAVLYFALPRDLLPDEWGVAGYVDDAAVALSMFWVLVIVVESYRSKLLQRLDDAALHT